jgi:hypothetical protein
MMTGAGTGLPEISVRKKQLEMATTSDKRVVRDIWRFIVEGNYSAGRTKPWRELQMIGLDVPEKILGPWLCDPATYFGFFFHYI